MPHPGSKSRRLRSAIIVVALVAVIGAITWTLIRDENSSPAPATSATAGATAIAAVPSADRNRAANASKPAAQLRHAAATRALPPPGTPLAQTYADLKARADAGDAAAASRLFHDIFRCVMAREQLLSAPTTAALLLEGDTSKLSAEQLTAREKHLANLEETLGKARRNTQLCEGLDETQSLLTPVMLQAARLGDVAASNCYVAGNMLADPRLFDHPEWLTEYKANALAMAQAGVAQGDWGMVAQLQHAYARDGYAMLALGRITGPDPVQNYRYLKLRRLGANSQNAPYYDKNLAFVAHDLSADEVAAGDAWAQDTYLRYFSAVPENTIGAHNSPTCADD
jgi:hypothetical protein